ncbi:hypothetical protein BGZ98_001982, partial [Dissophora globulifera]
NLAKEEFHLSRKPATGSLANILRSSYEYHAIEGEGEGEGEDEDMKLDNDNDSPYNSG